MDKNIVILILSLIILCFIVIIILESIKIKKIKEEENNVINLINNNIKYEEGTFKSDDFMFDQTLITQDRSSGEIIISKFLNNDNWIALNKITKFKEKDKPVEIDESIIYESPSLIINYTKTGKISSNDIKKINKSENILDIKKYFSKDSIKEHDKKSSKNESTFELKYFGIKNNDKIIKLVVNDDIKNKINKLINNKIELKEYYNKLPNFEPKINEIFTNKSKKNKKVRTIFIVFLIIFLIMLILTIFIYNNTDNNINLNLDNATIILTNLFKNIFI